MGKKRVGFFKFTSCSGCQMNAVRLLASSPLLDHFQVAYWPMFETAGWSGRLDAALVEGCVSTEGELEELRRVRESSDLLIALGECAVDGGVQSIAVSSPLEEVAGRVYEHPSWIRSRRVGRLGEYVEVDVEVHGCPPGPETLWEVLISLLLGRRPRLRGHPLCVECKLRGLPCLLLEAHKPCLGPVTNAGCGALCPSLNRVCEGCYGPNVDANWPSQREVLRSLGLEDRDVDRRFRKYAAARLSEE
ncbi:MAG: oxidoreductase [Candidatus Bathyarchaeota archaeon B23]|nr:MAG: oxidoreductase [Candidatus Bathyarchaeota archaeon B23]